MSDKYEFIDAEYTATTDAGAVDAPTVRHMCAWLDVSKSGFYEWRGRPESVTARRREQLKVKIEALFDYNDATYGHRRIHAELARAGERVGVKLARRLMRELDLWPCQPGPRASTTVRGRARPAAGDLLGRDFTADRPGTKLVGDLTYIRTWEGRLYSATVIDCFNRDIIGYAMADHMRAELVTAALNMAARNHNMESGCIMHSDHGSQHTSAEFTDALTDLGLRQSLGRTGICFDNALAELFNGVLKTERVHRTVYPTRKKARDDVAHHIELYYNRRRIHSGLDCRTPHEVRIEYLNGQLAA